MRWGGLTQPGILNHMAWSISDELATFIDDATRLLQRLHTEGERLSRSEIRILRAQLKRLNNASEPLDESSLQK